MVTDDESSNGTRTGELTSLEPGMVIPFGGRHWVRVDEDLARVFRPGDRLLVLQTDGTLIT